MLLVPGPGFLIAVMHARSRHMHVHACISPTLTLVAAHAQRLGLAAGRRATPKVGRAESMRTRCMLGNALWGCFASEHLRVLHTRPHPCLGSDHVRQGRLTEQLSPAVAAQT